MGIWFFIPLTLGIFLLFLTYYAFLNKETKWLAALFYLVTLFVYPIVSVVLAITIGMYLAVEWICGRIRIERKWIILGSAILLIGLSILFLFVYKNPKFLLNLLIVKYGWTGYHDTFYSIYALYGIPSMILAIVGIFFIFKQKYSKILLYPPILFLIPLVTYVLFKFAPIIPYQRSLVLFSMSLAPLSAIGLYHLFRYLYLALFYRKVLVISIIIIFSGALAAYTFQNYHNIDNVYYKPYYLINNAEYDSLIWMNEKFGSNNVLIAPWDIAFTVYPITKNRVVALPDSNLGYGDLAPLYQMYDYSISCDDKRNIMLNNHANMVFSRIQLNCDFLTEYKRNGAYIYVLK